MPTAEIITIGTELLLGEIQDTNTRHIARVLRNVGIDLYRTTTVGDNLDRIATVVKEAISRTNIIITTGGLGPTVDDPTRTAIAKALEVDIEFQPDLWSQIQTRFMRYGRVPTENNRRQAYIPVGSQPIENLVGTAPSFWAETGNGVLVSLPGVPREMEFILENSVLPLLKERFELAGIIKTFSIHTSGAGESHIDEKIGDLELLANPTVGLVAYPGLIDVRVTAKAVSVDAADKLIAEMVGKIEDRLGDAIFGYNETTIEQVVANHLKKLKLRVSVIEFGMDGMLSQRMKHEDVLLERTIAIAHLPEFDRLKSMTRNLYSQVAPNIVVSAILDSSSPEQSDLTLFMIKDDLEFEKIRSFGGHTNLSKPWAENTALDFVRKKLLQTIFQET